MAGINSTATTPEESACIIQAASDYCCNMQAFFDLAEREISEHNNTDFDGMPNRLVLLCERCVLCG